MTTLSYALHDSTTMLRRDIRHSLRNPMMTLSGLGLPVIFLLLFVGVFGHSLRAGLGGAIPIGGGYVDYLIPGILVMTAASCAEMTAIEMCTDMTEGIITRFRAMAITRASVLTGRVFGSMIRTLVSGALLVAVGFALGFRPTATPIEWVAVIALFALLALALSWLTVAFGLVAKTPAGANSLSLIVVVLPFISSAFVPTGAMPAGVRWVAQNQPFTPIIQSLRGLLTGTPIGNTAILAAAWCAGIAAVGYLWACARYNRGR
jgi:ABC-2 type transport system permease protein